MISVSGLWDDGVVLDWYKESCTYIGEDVFGHAQYDSVYTSIGKLLFTMKYNGHSDTSEEIADNCIEILETWLSSKKIDIILPAPPTNERITQPVYLIARALASKLGIPYSEEVLLKTDKQSVKNIPKEARDLSGSIVKLKDAKRKCNILLVDDFFSTGKTAGECVSVLKTDPLIDKVYYIAIAKTK